MPKTENAAVSAQATPWPLRSLCAQIHKSKTYVAHLKQLKEEVKAACFDTVDQRIVEQEHIRAAQRCGELEWLLELHQKLYNTEVRKIEATLRASKNFLCQKLIGAR